MVFTQVINKPKVKVTLVPKTDGVYIAVENTTGRPVTRAEVSTVIADDIVQDLDFNALEQVYQRTESNFEIKISNALIASSDEEINITVSPDKMSVVASFIKPMYGGKILSADEIKSKLNENGVVFGIKEEVIELLVTNKNYQKSYIIAEGEQPVDDTDGSMIYSFDIGKSTYKPKLNDDGTADFRNINMFKLAMKGQLLASTVEMTEGKDGKNVMGTPIPRKKGKKAPVLPKGKNVVSDESNKKLFAEISGQIIYVNGKINVFPMLEITGHVDNKTGNIDFNGSVTIRGDVLTGFRVMASGHIDIMGVIEGAFIQSGGDLVCTGGILGMNKAEIIVAGSVSTKNINNCELTAGGDIVTNQILHSKIECSGKIEVSAGKGFIVGGRVFSTQSIHCKIIGSSMATATSIEIGASQIKVAEYNALILEMTKTKAEYKKIDEAINAVTSSIAVNKLPPEKKLLLAKFENMREQVYERLEDLKEQINELFAIVNNNSGFLSVSDVIHPGVSITIGNAGMIVRDDIHHSRLYNDKAKIVIGSY